ncbi:MAG: hypothetical protein H0W50_11900 [Parachlamydiaceae bacterium]|nr:hypothetical protein [Parachlamydiaceae bacterium]
MQPVSITLKEAGYIIVSVEGHSRHENHYCHFYPEAPKKLMACELTALGAGYKPIHNTKRESSHSQIFHVWVECLAKQLIDLNFNYLTINSEFQPLKNLVQEQQIKINIDENLISGLECTQKELLDKIEKISIQNNLIQDSADQKDILLQHAYDLIKEHKETNEEQKAEITNFKRSVQDMDATISSLKDEKINTSNEIINLKSFFKIEKIEYKRRIKEFEVMNNYLLSELRKKAANSLQASSILCNFR